MLLVLIILALFSLPAVAGMHGHGIASANAEVDKVLVVYNTSSSDSIAVRNYYLANRPGFTNVNTLAITLTTYSDMEVISQVGFNDEIQQPVVDWLQANPLKQIYYIVLLRGIPDNTTCHCGSVSTQLSNAFSVLGIRSGTKYPASGFPFGTSQPYVPSQYPGTTALVTHLNMGSQAATLAYIDKLKAMYNAMSTPSVIISSQGASTHYYIDEAQGLFPPFLEYDYNALVSESVVSSRLTFAPASGSHITTGSNVLGYETWGYNGSQGANYANDGSVQFSGNSGWYLIKTVESLNGVWSSFQGTFINWFSSNAFGGINYSNTPVGAVAHTDEPFLGGVNGSLYLIDWEKGLRFVEAAWESRQTEFFMAIGDPLVVR